MSQIDKYCPICQSYCHRDCTFYNKSDDVTGKSSCQISNYLKANTPKKKTSKTLLEGSEKKT